MPLFNISRLLSQCCLTLLFGALGVLWSGAQTPEPREQYINEEFDQRDFDLNKWNKAKAGIDYSRETEKRAKNERESSDVEGEGGSAPSFEWMSAPLAGGLMKVLIIIGGIFVIAIIIRAIIGQGPRDKRLSRNKGMEINLERIEENIHESDLDSFIQQALDQKNYALALRLYYLAVLKALSQQKLINWKKDKTNYQYALEMRLTPYRSGFDEVTRIFERVWYGNSPMSAAIFKDLQPRFTSFLNEIEAIKKKEK